MSITKAWFTFAKRVWLALGVGWVVSSAALGGILNAGQAAALLICSALVAEVFNEKRHRLFVLQVQPGVKQLHLYREVAVPGENRRDIEITPHQGRSGKTTVNTSSWALYHLARPEEFYLDQESRLWDLERTMKRVERRVEYAIAGTAVVGTVLWAFG